ncbi:MAG: hypothetical protein HWE12_04050 [Oceanospirillaceae bacterium]|nr:hypothetical protein [Oceanospirillaceae bacterium]
MYKALFIDYGTTVILKGFVIALGLIVTPYLLIEWGLESFGIFAFAVASTNYISSIDFGLTGYLTVEFSRKKIRNRLIQRALRSVILQIVIAQTIGAAIVSFYITHIVEAPLNILLLTLITTAICLSKTILRLLSVYYIAKHKAYIINLYMAFYNSSRYILVMLFSAYGLWPGMCIFIASNTIHIGFLVLCLDKVQLRECLTRPRRRLVFLPFVSKRYFGYSFYSNMVFYSDRALAAGLLDLKVLGIYMFMVDIVSKINELVASMSSLLLPRLIFFREFASRLNKIYVLGSLVIVVTVLFLLFKIGDDVFKIFGLGSDNGFSFSSVYFLVYCLVPVMNIFNSALVNSLYLYRRIDTYWVTALVTAISSCIFVLLLLASDTTVDIKGFVYFIAFNASIGLYTNIYLVRRVRH